MSAWESSRGARPAPPGDTATAPGLPDLRCTGQQVQSLGQQIVHEESNWFVGNGLQGIGVYGIEFFWHENLLMVLKFRGRKSCVSAGSLLD